MSPTIPCLPWPPQAPRARAYPSAQRVVVTCAVMYTPAMPMPRVVAWLVQCLLIQRMQATARSVDRQSELYARVAEVPANLPL